ncbi:hypothetical protein ACLBWT_18630 [Paenibacillus sp. D51F]
MRHFFDPSLLPVTTTDLDGNFLYARTHGLHYYGYPDIIVEQGGEEAELLLLDILDRIFSLEFNINATWNYNGRLFRLETGDDGLAHVVYPEADEARIVTILNPDTGLPAKHFSKGLMELFNHPEAEVNGEIPHSKEILLYVLDQVKAGELYDEEVVITYEGNAYGINCMSDRLGKPLIEIYLQQPACDQPRTERPKKSRASHLSRVK